MKHACSNVVDSPGGGGLSQEPTHLWFLESFTCTWSLASGDTSNSCLAMPQIRSIFSGAMWCPPPGLAFARKKKPVESNARLISCQVHWVRAWIAKHRSPTPCCRQATLRASKLSGVIVSPIWMTGRSEAARPGMAKPLCFVPLKLESRGLLLEARN